MNKKLYIFSSLVTATLLAACGSNYYAPPGSTAQVANFGPGVYGPGDAMPSVNEPFTQNTQVQNTQQIGIGGVTQNPQIDYSPQYANAQAPVQYQQQQQYVESTDTAAAYFQPQFASYGGRWVNVPGYGNCWQPTAAAPDWRPYMFGHWVYTDDYGWYWVSEEPFGWATYHYGRWAQLDIGWCWVPGRIWGPAWVSWQSGDGYSGWAPLPPARYGRSVGQEVAGIHPFSYSFVEDRFFNDRNVRNHYQPVTRNVTLINNTRNITRIETTNNRIVNRGVDLTQVEKAAGAKVEHVKVRDVQSVKQVGATASTVETFRPQVPAATPKEKTVAPPKQTPQQTQQQQNPQPQRQAPQPQPSPTIKTPAVQPQPQQVEQPQQRSYLDQLDKEMQDRHHKEREAPNVNADQIKKRQENEARLLREQQQRIAPRPQQQPQTPPQPQPQKIEPPKPQPQKVEQPAPTPPRAEPTKEQPRPNPGKGNNDDKNDDNPGKGPKDK